MKLILLFLFSTHLSAAVIEDCGDFKLRGTVAVDEKTKDVKFVILKDTKSEMKFDVTEREDILKIAGIKDYGIELIAVIPKRLDGMKGEIRDISNIHTIMLDPLKSSEDIELLKIKKCVL